MQLNGLPMVGSPFFVVRWISMLVPKLCLGTHFGAKLHFARNPVSRAIAFPSTA
jgi:hypothetical protein